MPEAARIFSFIASLRSVGPCQTATPSLFTPIVSPMARLATFDANNILELDSHPWNSINVQLGNHVQGSGTAPQTSRAWYPDQEPIDPRLMVEMTGSPQEQDGRMARAAI
jgi:hypothetical protein